MIASLPMYAFPRTEAAEARLWVGIRDRLRDAGIDAPDSLTPVPDDLRAHWTDPGLILSQTCGRPYKDHLHGQVRLVGTPDYGWRVARRAITGASSSRAPTTAAEISWPSHGPLRLQRRGIAIRLGRAGRRGARGSARPPRPDRQPPRLDPRRPRGPRRFRRHRRRHLPPPERGTGATGLRIIHATAPRPGLPLITSATQDPAPLFDATRRAIAALAPADRDTLGLRGLIRIPAEDYLALPDP
jgi:hypothetical protein